MFTFNLQLLSTETTDTLSDEMAEFYKTQLIEQAKPALFFNKFGDKYDIPKGNGKTISIRKFKAYKPATTPLTEGVTPEPHHNEVVKYNPTIEQYGDFVEESDLLCMTAVDPIISTDTELNADQMALTLDTVTRDVLATGTNVLFAKKVVDGEKVSVDARDKMDKTSLLTGDEIRKSAATLKGVNAKKIDNAFIGIVHPHASASIQADKAWIDASKYATPEQLLEGEIGKLYGVRFYESSNAKIFKSAGCPVDTDVAPTFDSTETYAKDDLVSYTDESESAPVPKVYKAKGSVSAGDFDPDDWTEVTDGTGYLSVYSTMIIAKHAYATTEIEGQGSGVIVKQLGSGGTSDALNQRATVGWKANHVAQKLGDEFMIRIESVGEDDFANTDAN